MKRIAQETFDTQHGGEKDYGHGTNTNRSARKALENFAENGNGRRNIRSVWTIATQPFKGAHFATFPQKLAETCIKAGSKPGDTVLDPFSGAGTTGLVATKLGRDYIGIELNAAYNAMAKGRIENMLVTVRVTCGGE